MPELDENEYAMWQAYKPILEKIGADPEARELAQRAIAKVAPERAGPEIRIRSELDTRLGGIEKTITDFIAEQKKEREEREAAAQQSQLSDRWTAGRRKLRDAGYNDEGIEAIEQLMETRGVADHEAAAALFDRLNPPPEPVMSNGTSWDFFGNLNDDAPDAALRAFMESSGQNDEAFLSKMIPSAIQEARGQRR